ncbi:phosphatase PAP2 family protein [Mucilaginibacter psychrotolerans]|uniref:Phosphatase PAP2 family protein n=1 Tax=Mucilaginibacter psychrotolerans TaxID=1524096 RepID=A0A4Y8SD43_9SPHI|nr:phosphatase PAP2 family protein [Mucilaginibacter psychrotolerans]TFF36354.1 phosphatase PAP2 family protein [Mucilaginibacter psychrotolerans]
MKKIFLILLSVVTLTASAQIKVSTNDSLKTDSANLLALPDTVKNLSTTWQSFIPPAAFVTYGALSFNVKAIRNLDFSIDRDAQEDHPGNLYPIENYLQYAPIAMVYGLNFAGVHGKNTFIDRTILLGLSEGIFGLATFGLKRSSGRLRPNGADRLSFPSGHAGSAFVAAEFMAQEYGDKSPMYGVLGYTFATATAVLRVYNHKHWFSDIVAGAGFGILGTKAAYALYPLFRNKLFHDDKSSKQSMIMPTFSDGVVGFVFTKQL